MAERIKLTITEVKEPRAVGQAEVLELLAVGPDNKTLKYGAWNKSFYEYIKKGAVIDADIETKVSDKTDPNGEHYVSRKIVQLYSNGQPVIKKSTGRTYGKSPEEIRAERQSIEAQVAVKAITDLEVAGKSVKPELLSLRDAWLKNALTNCIKCH
ncbi:MAG TPA: hypothetical protein PLB48_12170 [Treponema sp.]|nr:hypothetical protein [Treponema sp.]